MTDALIYDAIRTPRGKGKPGGGLYEVKPIDLLVVNLYPFARTAASSDATTVGVTWGRVPGKKSAAPWQPSCRVMASG